MITERADLMMADEVDKQICVSSNCVFQPPEDFDILFHGEESIIILVSLLKRWKYFKLLLVDMNNMWLKVQH